MGAPAPSARGKVRDIYDLGDELLLVATDRVSAYDVVLPTDIPGKGSILTALSVFWFSQTKRIVPNHLISDKVEDFPDIGLDPDYLRGRTLLVKKAKVTPIECIVRGYLSGSGWKEYQKQGTVCGEKLPEGLVESQRLPMPIFTPSTKATEGHDENISFERMQELILPELARRLREISLHLYTFAADYAIDRGLIIADTKFEFGIADKQITLIDEVLTPDSSRFWPSVGYQAGGGQPSFDKQFVRDWLDESGWDHQPPGPELPAEIIEKTSDKYIEAYQRLTGCRWTDPTSET